jgi:hypothetical protein
MGKVLLSLIIIFIFVGCESSDIHKLGEAKCNKLVAIEEIAWSDLIDSINKVGWDKSIPEIRDWSEKQINARKYCVGPNNYLYDGITTLNKRINEFGNAGGYKVNY